MFTQTTLKRMTKQLLVPAYTLQHTEPARML